jgi:hypothetical protein
MAEALTCPCGVPVEQPWRQRDKLWSPASFIGGLVWLVIGTASAVAGFNPAGVILLGLLALLVAGSLVLQAIRRHRGPCLVRRGPWFGLALPGLPLRVAYWFNF